MANKLYYFGGEVGGEGLYFLKNSLAYCHSLATKVVSTVKLPEQHALH